MSSYVHNLHDFVVRAVDVVGAQDADVLLGGEQAVAVDVSTLQLKHG